MKSFKRQFLEKYVDDYGENGLDPIEQELLEAIEKDESPESSVWPGERKVIQKISDCIASLGGLSDIIGTVNSWKDSLSDQEVIDALDSWLQSRTAVKAEEYSEKLCNQKEIDLWQRIFDRCKEIYPLKKATDKYIEIVGILKPQPTAGGVKEEEQWDDPAEVMILKDALKNIVSCIDNENPTHENIWRIADAALNGIACAPPSPSNPSIKRPSQDEIEKAVNEKYEGTNLKPAGIALCINAWTAAINWLLSIQSDNK